jgi:hypothetical protein
VHHAVLDRLQVRNVPGTPAVFGTENGGEYFIRDADQVHALYSEGNLSDEKLSQAEALYVQLAFSAAAKYKQIAILERRKTNAEEMIAETLVATSTTTPRADCSTTAPAEEGETKYSETLEFTQSSLPSMDILLLQAQIIDTDLQIQTIDESHCKYVSDQLRHLNTRAGTFPGYILHAEENTSAISLSAISAIVGSKTYLTLIQNSIPYGYDLKH